VAITVQPGADLVYVTFSAEVNPSTTESLIATMANCANFGVKKVCLLLSTPGGSVTHGLNLYNVLRAMPFELSTYNVGNVDSIGNVIFAAGARRYAAPHATFMFHGVGFDAPGGQRLEEKNLRELLDSVQANHRRIGDIMALRSDLKAAEISTLFLEAQTRDAQWALGKGIIHEISEVQIPPGTPVLSLVFQR
jgi:ATP-dependent Clp protease, protease subunit